MEIGQYTFMNIALKHMLYMKRSNMKYHNKKQWEIMSTVTGFNINNAFGLWTHFKMNLKISVPLYITKHVKSIYKQAAYL